MNNKGIIGHKFQSQMMLSMLQSMQTPPLSASYEYADGEPEYSGSKFGKKESQSINCS
jgi:hypothetical protein